MQDNKDQERKDEELLADVENRYKEAIQVGSLWSVRYNGVQVKDIIAAAERRGAKKAQESFDKFLKEEGYDVYGE